MKTRIFAVILCLIAVVCLCTLVSCDEETDCTHASKQWVEEVSASCTTDGTVGHYACPDCNEKMDADGKPITDLTLKAAHSPKSEWSVADGKHYHACADCDAKLDEAECSGGEATCTEKATCTVCQNEYGAEPSHTPASEWSVADGKHYHACADCDAKLDEAACSGGEASCTEKATCTVCQNKYGPEPSHTPASEWSVADGKHYHACQNCTVKLDEDECSGGQATCTQKAKCSVCQNEYGDFGGHVYDVSKYDEDHHWMECACGEKGTLVVHSYTSSKVTPPTCTEGGFTTYTCDCGHSYQDDETDPVDHKYSEKWDYDGSHHWHEATCGCEDEISAYEKHRLTANVTAPTCTAQGYTVYTCACGYESDPTEFVPATGHSVSEWSETGSSVLFDAAKCEYTVQYSGVCGVCGGTDTKTEQMEKHSLYASITTPATCKTEGVKSWFCSSEQCVYHNVAHHTENYTDASAHVWVVNNDKSKGNLTVYKCRDCNATKTQSTESSADISGDDLKDMSEIELSDSKGGSDQNIVIGIDKDIQNNLSGKDVNISAGTLDDDEKQNAMNQSNLSPEQQALLDGCQIYDFTLSTSTPVSKLGGWATIRIPYTLQPGDDPNSIIVWYINNGTLEAIEAVYAEDADGKGYVTFRTDHFSYYTVAQIDPADICKQLDKHDATQLHVIAPTCTTGGYTVCLRCGEQVEGSAVPALGHTLNAVVTVEATCTNAGRVHYTCANCDLTYDAATPAIGHYHVLTEQITATCQTVGSTTYACVHCQDSYTMTTPKLNHTYHTTVVAPTCDTNGYTEKTCTQCGNVVKAAYTTAVGHIASTEWYRDQDSHYHVCTTCGEKMGEDAHTPGAAATETTAQICTVCEYTIAPPVQHVHELTKVNGVQATCTTSGNIEYYTCACGTWFADADAQMLISDHASVIVDAKGHTVESTPYEEPTCEEVGYTAGVWCSACETYLRGHVMISAYGHDYHQSVKAPTCTEQGSITYRCSHCGDTDGMQGEVIEALGHNVTAVVTAPTCTENGYTTYSCTRCDYHDTDKKTEALGHNYSSAYLFNEEGHYHSCTRCDAVTEMERHIADYPEATEAHGISCVKCNYKIAEAIAHTHNPTCVSKVEPACESSGNIEYYVCTCGEWFADEACEVVIYHHSDVIVPPTGHKLVYHAAQKATCTESGYTAGILCENCLTWQSGHEVTAPIGHSFQNNFQYDEKGHWELCQSCGTATEIKAHLHGIEVTEPTCTTAGYTTYTCACGHTYTGDETAALDHTFGKWISTADGQHMRICENDASHVDVADCAYSSEVFAPTCEKNGYTKHTCEMCGHSYRSDETDALGHDFGEWTYDGKDGHVRVCKNDPSHTERQACVKSASVIEPTCTEGGYLLYFCDICKNSYKDHEVSALGHKYDGGRCEHCGEIDEKVVYQYREQYQTENGMMMMEEALFCPDGTVGLHFYEIVDGQASLLESGISYWKAEDPFVFVYADQTCTRLENCYTVDENGTLTEYVCEKHEFIQQSYQSATCTEEGSMTRACRYCGEITHTVYPALGHDFDKWRSDGNGGHTRYCYRDKSHVETGVCEYTEQIVPPTCEQDGYTEHSCKLCNGHYEDNFVPAVEHDYRWASLYSGRHQGTCVYDDSHTVSELCVYQDGTCLVCGNTVTDQNITYQAQYTRPSEDGSYILTELYTFYDNGVVGIVREDGTVASMLWLLNGKYLALYENLNVETSFVGSAVITDQGELVFCVCEDGNHGDVSFVDMVHPSCTEDGFSISQCMICGERFTEVLPAMGHVWSAWQPIYDDIHQPSKQHTRWCQYDMSHREIADCHYVTKVIAPTCTENGYTLYECECGSHYMTDETPATGHSFVDGRCEICNKSEFPEVIYSFAGEIIGADGTYYEEIFCYDIGTVVLKRYTVSADGTQILLEEKSMYWSLANKNTMLMVFADQAYNDCYYSFDLSEDGTLTPHVCESHSYKILVDEKLPTCEEAGYSIYRCYYCQVTLTKTSDALGHVYGEWTQAEGGVHVQICANDASHMLTELCQYTHEHKDATCTKDGYSGDVCSVCKARQNVEKIPATGHSFTDGICQACGAWEPVDENDVLDEAYRATVLKEMSAVWKEISNEYTPSAAHTKEYTEIRQAMQAANSKAELQHYYGEFETLIKNIENEAGDNGFREDILKQMNSTWVRWMTEGRTITEEQQTEFFRMYDAVKQAADTAEIQSWYEKFNEFVLRVENGDQGGDVTVDEKLRQEILSAMNMKWADIMAQNAATAEQQMMYEQLCAAVMEAISNQEIHDCYAEFQELVWQIENSQSPDAPIDEEYRQEIYQQINNRYRALTQSFPAMDSVLRKQLSELRTAVKSAVTYTELNGYVAEFDALEQQILAAGDEISNYRYSVLMEIFPRWTDLQERGLVTSEYNTEYNTNILQPIRNALTVEEIDTCCELFEDLVRRMEEGGTEEVVDEAFRNETLVQMQNEWQITLEKYVVSDAQQILFDRLIKAIHTATSNEMIQSNYDQFRDLLMQVENNQSQDDVVDEAYRQIVSAEILNRYRALIQSFALDVEVKNQLTTLRKAIQSAITQSELNGYVDEFYMLEKQIITEGDEISNYRYETMLAIYIRWEELKAEGLVKSDYTTEYNEITICLRNALTAEEINEWRQRFNDLVYRMTGEVVGGVDEADRQAKLTIMQDRWKIVSEKFSVSEDSALYAEQLMAKVQNAETVEDLEWAYNEFMSLVADIENGSSESIDRKALLEDMWNTWNMISAAYGVTADDQAHFEKLVSMIQTAASDDEVLKYFDEFKMLVSRIENGGSGDSAVDEVYREDCLNEMWRRWNNYMERYGCTETDQKNFDHWINRVQSATSNEQIDQYFFEFDHWMSGLEKDAEIVEDYVEEIWLDQTQFTVTVGTDVQKFIAENLVGMNLYIRYSQSGLQTIPVTYEMIVMENEAPVFDTIGRYFFSAEYQEKDFYASMGITVIVQPDMSNANLLGEYTVAGALVGSSEDWTLKLYDNGYAVLSMETVEGYPEMTTYTLEGNLLYLDSNEMILVMELNEETREAVMYQPTDALIGTYYYYDVMFQVYGTYTGAGDYITVMTYMGIDGAPVQTTTYVTLDLENRTMTSAMLGGSLSFDENGNLGCNHVYAAERRDPTCTEPGFVNEYCIHCGESSYRELPPLGHSFIDGVCERCGYSEDVELQQIILETLSTMEWEWNSLWADYGEMNSAMLVQYQAEYDARYEKVKSATTLEEVRSMLDGFIDTVEKIRSTLGAPMNSELERVRQELLNNMDFEWNQLMRELGGNVDGSYWNRYYELVERMNSVTEIDMLYNIFDNEFWWLMDETREAAANQDVFMGAYLEQRKFELTEGHGYDLKTFIEKYIIGKILYVEYSQSGIVEIPITWEMLDYTEMDISAPGEYEIGVHYSDKNFGTWHSMRIVVWMDMSAATHLGTYSCDLSCMGEEDVMTMEIYDNGYAFVYFNGDTEDRELLPCMMENGVIYLDTGDGIYVMRIDGEGTAYMYEATEDESIIGVYTYEDEISITVYGTYEGVGLYIAKAAIVEDGEMFWLALLVELDLENRTIVCDVFGRDPISFDENGNLLDEDSSEDTESDSGSSGDVGVELPIDPVAPTPDNDNSYGEITAPSEGTVGGDYTYTDTADGTISYVATTDGYAYGMVTVA